MRKKMQLLQVVLCIACFVITPKIKAASTLNDSVKIVHVTDGSVTEWQKDRFEKDKETEVLYAVDHDENNLYLALKIPDMKTQMKMMRMGTSLYIDKKGKRKEGTGIQFPLKTGVAVDPSSDPRAMRDQLAPSLIFLRTVGFDDEDKTQPIASETRINIAFNWDEADVMYIEYQVPMSMIGKKADLAGKLLGIGWKINGASAERTMTSREIVSVPAGGSGRASGTSIKGGSSGPSAGGSMGNSSSSAPRDDAFTKEQSFWTKYNLNF